MIHIHRITVAKASMNDENDDHGGGRWWDPQDLIDLLGGSVQDVLLTLVEAKGKGSAS